jgi:hypothetical protein
MLHVLKFTFAATLVMYGTSVSLAQRTGPRAPSQVNAQRANPLPYSFQGYGLDATCSNRPFAPGCDKRGQW